MYQLDRLKSLTGLVHGFSEKPEGNMSFRWQDRDIVIEHRNKFLDELGIKPKNSVMMELQHGLTVRVVGQKDAGSGMINAKPPITADALITNISNLFLLVLTADCLPIILYDRVKKVLGLAHLSRANTDKKFCAKVIEAMYLNYKTSPHDLLAGIGPGIHKESYLFPKDDITTRTPDWDEFLKDLPDDRTAVDITGYNARELARAGVLEENIEVSEVDTAKDYNFFSHHRSRRTGEEEGRMAAVAGLL